MRRPLHFVRVLSVFRQEEAAREWIMSHTRRLPEAPKKMLWRAGLKDDAMHALPEPKQCTTQTTGIGYSHAMLLGFRRLKSTSSLGTGDLYDNSPTVGNCRASGAAPGRGERHPSTAGVRARTCPRIRSADCHVNDNDREPHCLRLLRSTATRWRMRPPASNSVMKMEPTMTGRFVLKIGDHLEEACRSADPVPPQPYSRCVGRPALIDRGISVK
jgi:hypothetical protein